MVRRVVLLGIVGMDAVGIVGRHHEGACDGAAEVLLIAAERFAHAAEQVGQHGRVGALLGAAAGLFVVKYGHYAGHAGVGALDQRGKCGMGHREVVEAA